MNFSGLTQDVVLAIVRHLLTLGGGLLISKGIITATQEETIIGGLVALVGVIWSLVQKKNANAKLKAALAAPKA